MLKRFFLFIVLPASFLFYSAYFFWYKPTFNKQNSRFLAAPGSSSPAYKVLQTKAAALKSFARAKNYNSDFCFLVNMNTGSGNNRFFVYDLKKDSILLAGLVAHGRCNQWWLEGRKYGNEPGCGCTSLGKYRIGHSYMGQFGLAYKLYGLDSSNSNAFKRFVVLHSHSCVPDAETDPAPICQSNGCPMVSPGFLQKLKPLIDESKKPVLLWIFDN